MQNILAEILLALVFIGLLLAGGYIWTLTRFFKELRGREPDVWQKIGSPTLLNMLFLPFIKFHKFHAFLPVLKARRDDDSYRYARRAWLLLRAGLIFVLLVFLNALWLGLSLTF